MLKNKFFGILIILVIVIGLTGCGNSNKPYNTTENNKSNSQSEKEANYKEKDYSTLTVHNKKTDTTEYISLSKITEINSSNSAKFDQNYRYSSIRFVAKVYKVSYNTYYSNMTALGEVDLLYLGKDSFDGLLVVLPTGKYDLASLETGDLVYVETNILYSDFDNYLTLAGTNGEDSLSTQSINNTKIEIINDKSNKEIDELLK